MHPWYKCNATASFYVTLCLMMAMWRYMQERENLPVHTMNAYLGVAVWLHSFLTLALGGSESSASQRLLVVVLARDQDVFARSLHPNRQSPLTCGTHFIHEGSKYEQPFWCPGTAINYSSSLIWSLNVQYTFYILQLFWGYAVMQTPFIPHGLFSLGFLNSLLAFL
jgi:hypothetical protein